VVPDGAMRAHDDHTIEKGHAQEIKVEIFEGKNKEAADEHQYPRPAKKGQPVLFVPEDI
jgi:hypothetical protein